MVAPFTGARIEMLVSCESLVWPSSLPSRERGLKSEDDPVPAVGQGSLPSRERGLKYEVCRGMNFVIMSLPSRERGLKSYVRDKLADWKNVAPFTGAWIEMTVHGQRPEQLQGRSLHGSVD